MIFGSWIDIIRPRPETLLELVWNLGKCHWGLSIVHGKASQATLTT
ncbi:hypothetical protein V6Z12_A04G080300 [Gossypium hirsutum]